MKRTLFLFVGLFTLFSCAVDDVDTASRDDSTNFTTDSNQYSISEEEALANLYAFMGEGGDSRSSDNRVVNSVVPIKYNSLGTRAVEGVDCDNLLYIANFENEEGYAILAGDTRIDDEVIGITDRGSLDPETLGDIIVEWEPNARTYYDEYPMTGPSFYTTPETGDQLILNPNTADLYIAEEQDTLVGNFTLEEDSIGSRTYNDNINSFDYNAEHFALSLTTSYAMRELIEFEPNPRDDGDDDNTRVIITTSGWQIIEQVNPILDIFKEWHQQSPFNKLSPNVRHPIKFWLEPRPAYAGCFPLAIAKLMTHFNMSSYMPFGIYIIDLNLLKRDYHAYGQTEAGKFIASHLLASINSDCNSLPLWGGTFTLPSRAESFMSSIGFDNVERLPYNFDIIKYMLNLNKPTIIMSIPRWHIFQSHAWNIDGYKIKRRNIKIEIYVDGILQDTITEHEDREMVHCDFGWRGDANGYYVSGVFDLNDPYIEHDPYSDTDKDYYYKWYLRFIYYDFNNAIY